MFFISGTRNCKIKKFYDQNIICSICGNPFHDVIVYRRIVHLFFIPIIPTTYKYAEKICSKCHYQSKTFNKEYASQARTSLLYYWFPFLVAILIGFVIVASLQTKKENAIYVKDPRVKDVYLIWDDKSEPKRYFFLKVVKVDNVSSTVKVIHSAFQYDSYVTEMDKKDYFVKGEFAVINKDNLQKMLNDGLINSVNRNYSSENQYNVEK